MTNHSQSNKPLTKDPSEENHLRKIQEIPSGVAKETSLSKLRSLIKETDDPASRIAIPVDGYIPNGSTKLIQVYMEKSYLPTRSRFFTLQKGRLVTLFKAACKYNDLKCYAILEIKDSFILIFAEDPSLVTFCDFRLDLSHGVGYEFVDLSDDHYIPSGLYFSKGKMIIITDSMNKQGGSDES